MKLSIRFRLLQAGMFGGFAILLASLIHTQVIRGGHFRRASEQNRIRLIRMEAPRGNILDRSGVVLATNRPSHNVYIVPEDFDPQDIPELSRLLGLSEQEIRQRISRGRAASFTPVLLAEDISKKLAIKIEERRPGLAGVFNQARAVRTYPEGRVAAHVLGYLGKISKDQYEYADRSIYYRDSWVGKTGMERVHDLLLRGEDGGRQIEVNARGVPVRVLSEKEPRRGSDLALSIDARLESGVRPLLKDKRSAVMAMDLATGEILLAMSTPDFDPNVFVERGRMNERLDVLGSNGRPLVNKGLSGLYPPGSVFKLVTAMAALESGVITPRTTFKCPGYFQFHPNSRRFKCWFSEGHGRVDLYMALERSCNVYFYNTGRLLGEKRLADYARRLGFGTPLTFDLPSVSGVVPDREWKQAHYHDQWYPGDTISFAIGQGYLLVSPFQILRLISVIARDGEMAVPKLVRGEAGEIKEPAKKISFSPGTFRALKQGMLRVVASEKGTGQLARVDFMKLAAKTGSAQAPPGDAHAWFGGFFPYEDPQIALVVFVERGRSGGIAAAKLARQIIETWHQLGGEHGSTAI